MSADLPRPGSPSDSPEVMATEPAPPTGPDKDEGATLDAARDRILNTLVGGTAVDDVLVGVLAELGTATHAQRGHYVRLDWAEGKILGTHHWSRSGKPWPGRGQGLPIDLIADLLRRLVRGRPVVITDGRPHVPEEVSARLQALGMVATLFVPVTVGEQLDGFLLVGWDHVHRPPQPVVDLVGHAGRLVALHLARQRAEAACTELEAELAGHRRSADERQERARARAQLFVDVLPELFVFIDTDGCLSEFHGPGTADQMATLGGLVGQPVIDVFGDHSREELAAVLGQVRAGHGPAEFDFDWPDENTLRHFEVRFGLEHDGRIIGVVREVTGSIERDRLAHAQSLALAEANEELQRVVQERDEFLAGVSHELRTPLNAILGLTEMLLDDGAALSLDQESSLKTIESSGRHLLELINDLLDLSRLRARVVTLDLHELPVGDPTRLSVDLVRPRALRKGLNVELVNATDDLRLVADERRLRQVLINLLDNAVKFTDPGGSIGLRVWRPDPDHVSFTVWDTGVGIPPPDHLRVFEPFTQLDGRRRNAPNWRGPDRRRTGSGLGLSLVERLVFLHGGRIDVDSSPGRGSRFTVVLPIAGPPTE